MTEYVKHVPKTPANVMHLLHPVHSDTLRGKWCELRTLLGEVKMEGWYGDCWRCRRNLDTSEVTPCTDTLVITEKTFNGSKYIGENL